MLYYVIAFFLALVPFTVWMNVGEGIRTPKEIASIIGLIAIIAVGLANGLRPRVNKWLFIFLGWCFVDAMLNMNLPIKIWFPDNKLIMQLPTLMIVWKELFYITLAVTAISVISQAKSLSNGATYKLCGITITPHHNFVESDIRGLANVITWVIIVMCSYMIVQALGLDNFFRCANYMGAWGVARTNLDPRFHLSHRVVGTLGNPTIAQTWIAMCVPFCLFTIKRFRGKLALLLSTVTLVLAASGTAIAATLGGVFFYLVMRKKYLISLILALLLAGGIFGASKFHDLKTLINPTGRIEVHKVAWEMIQARPLLGYGVGSFEYKVGLDEEVVGKLKNQRWKELHDEYGQLWFTTGLIGLGIFLCVIFSTFTTYLRNRTGASTTVMASLVAFLILCVTLFPMRIAPTSLYAVVFLGLALNLNQKGGSE